MCKRIVGLSVLLTALWTSFASAAIVVPVLSSSANLNSFNGPAELTNNSGLSAAVNGGATLSAAAGVTHTWDGAFGQSWVTNNSGTDYFATPNFGFTNKPSFVWDLGAAASVDNIVLWNYQNNGGGTAVGNHATTINLRFSESATFAGTPFTYNLSPVVGPSATNAAQVFSLSAIAEARNARYVEVTIMDNAVGHTGVTGGGDRVGLGEVRFDVSAAGSLTSTLLVAPTAITQTQGNSLAGFDPINLINSSGLSAAPTTSNFGTVTNAAGSGNTWVTSTATNPNYFNGVNPDPQFVLNLGGKFELTDLILWGYGGNSNEASDFTVEFSLDGGATYYDSVDLRTGAYLDTRSVALTLGDNYFADFVRLTITDNVNGRNLTGLGGGDRVGLGEIRFLAVVPEPASVLLWSILGIAGVACGVFRVRRR